MNTIAQCLLPFALVLGACSNSSNAPSTTAGAAVTATPMNTGASPVVTARADADNTRVNARDKGDSLTPMDQGGSDADRKITQQIRQDVVADSTLSMTAKNVKIITQNGKVTLRGPVQTDQERMTIEADAKKIAGATQVDNQLEVKK